MLIRAVLDRATKRAAFMCKGNAAEASEVRRRWKAAAAEILTPTPATAAPPDSSVGWSSQPKGGAAGINLGTGTSQWAARMYPPTGVTGEDSRPRYSTALSNHNNR